MGSKQETPDVTERATFGGGCFWCLEAVYGRVRGVLHVESGYSGGDMPDPDYRAVCEGGTGHAEVVRITFDPERVSYDSLLEVFFAIHDPTTPNRQGNDIGSQYRSVIFYHSPAQKVAAEKAIAREGMALAPDKRVVTELLPAPTFYPAEDYHQRYFERNPGNPYCQFVVSEKIGKFLRRFPLMLDSKE